MNEWINKMYKSNKTLKAQWILWKKPTYIFLKRGLQYQLSWQNISAMVIYKNVISQYLTELLHTYTRSRTLRSDNSSSLVLPHTRLSTMGARSFSSTAPRLWNSLPLDLSSSDSLHTFKSHLKTHLFKQAFFLTIFYRVLLHSWCVRTCNSLHAFKIVVRRPWVSRKAPFTNKMKEWNE